MTCSCGQMMRIEETGSTMLLGTKGGLTLNPLTVADNEVSYQSNVTPNVPKDRAVNFAGHWSETEHLIRVLRGEEELIVKKEQVLNVMGKPDAFYKSAAEGREVQVEG